MDYSSVSLDTELCLLLQISLEFQKYYDCMNMQLYNMNTLLNIGF